MCADDEATYQYVYGDEKEGAACFCFLDLSDSYSRGSPWE